MKLHEYQAKELFASVKIPVCRAAVATTPEQAASVYETLRDQTSTDPFVCNVKAQIHAGGRGKSGGILIARSAQEACDQAESLLGRRLVTKQTSSEGLPISAVLLEERMEITQELYLALTIDRFQASPVILASRRGGMDIEEVAATDPSAILHERFDIFEGPTPATLARIPSGLGLSGALADQCRDILCGLWKLYESHDASLIEVNPLIVSPDGKLIALDAKVLLDDNALFRHPDLAKLRDESQEHPLELKASRIGISYVGLEGDIGCLVNGAGLAMATNDIIKLCGGGPANFLDVGGGANVEQVAHAFRIILADSRIRAILVNIFGGIMRCDWIAQGLLNATQELQVRIPIVVRLQGTNVEEGRRLLTQAQRLNLVSAEELSEAAKKVVELAQRS